LLEKERLLSWILKSFQEEGFRFQEGVPEKLIEFIGNDLWALNNELKKLFLYKNKEKVINLKDIDILIKPKMEADIFKTIDQLAKKDKKNLLEMIHAHLEKGDSPLYIFSMFIFQLRNLLLISELKKYPHQKAVLIKSLGVKPFVIKKLSSLGKNLNAEQLKYLYKKIFEIETKIKTGEIEPVLGLDLFISEI
jgi:DNA polymerase-3 subunit delta